MKNLKFNKILSKPKRKLELISNMMYSRCRDGNYFMYIDGEEFYEYKKVETVICLILDNTITGWAIRDEVLILEYINGEYGQYIYKKEG